MTRSGYWPTLRRAPEVSRFDGPDRNAALRLGRTFQLVLLDNEVYVFFRALDGSEPVAIALRPLPGRVAHKPPHCTRLLPDHKSAIVAFENHPVHGERSVSSIPS